MGLMFANVNCILYFLSHICVSSGFESLCVSFPELRCLAHDLGPWKPVIRDDKLYGRGGADDGYALFACIAAVNSLIKQGVSLPRIIILIEFCEESGSPDLPYYMEDCKDIIGDVDLVICLDSGAGNYEQFWSTVSLRGMISVFCFLYSVAFDE